MAHRPPQVERSVKRTSRDRIPIQNKILLSMTETEFGSIRPQLEHVRIPSHRTLCESNELYKSVYFPNSGLISIVVVLSNGKTVEAGVIGKEGVVGLPGIAGRRRSPLREVVQISGPAFRMNVTAFRKILGSAPILAETLKRYTIVFGLQVAQTAACNRLHDVEQRLARWLLMALDRTGSDLLQITQDFLATMLGTDRSSVSLAAGALQKMHTIKYSRGTVTVSNRHELEGCACECYRAIQNHHDGWTRVRG